MASIRLNKNGDIPERSIHLAVMQYVRNYPNIAKYVLHIPNESKRTPAYGGLLRAMGMRKGVSDLFIALPRKTHHGAWIELKTTHGKPSKEQLSFLQDMARENYFCEITYGLDEALEVVKWYCSL